jgi:predicted RNA-binding protein YlxR (DUF448 family)
MTRGGRARMGNEPERRCIVTGKSGPTAPLLRFVRSPEGVLVADPAGRLPGRGAWLTADREALARACGKKLFARAFRAPVTVPEGLPAAVEAMLARRVVDALGIARKAGLAVAGFDAVHARLKAGRAVGALIEAADGAEQGRARLRPLAGDAPRIDCLTGAELGLAFGREIVIHAVLDSGGATENVVREHHRLSGFRRHEGAGDQ